MLCLLKVLEMSRIGKLPIEIPAGVNVSVSNDSIVTVKGPLGELKQFINPDIKVVIEPDLLTVTRPDDSKINRAIHGLYRSLINNMVIGVSKGFEIKQELVGVGYKAEATGQELRLSLHIQVVFCMSSCPTPVISITGEILLAMRARIVL